MRGFTLVELVLSLGITVLLLGGMVGLVTASSRSLVVQQRAAGVAVADVLDRIVPDLAEALTIVEATARAVEFTVPDRDGDGNAESIRYEWQEDEGGGLIRTENGSSKAFLAKDVRSFALEYEVATETRRLSTVTTTTPEQLVASWNGGILLTERTVSSGKPLAQNVVATLPTGAMGWTVTRARFSARVAGAAKGETMVQVQSTGVSGVPRGTVLGEVLIKEADLPSSFGMHEVTFSGMPMLAAQEEIAFVFNWVSDAHSIGMGVATLGLSRSAAFWTYGSSWTASLTSVIPHEVYATVTSTHTPETTTKRVIRAAVTLRVGPAEAVRVSTTLLNAPEVP